jgi:endogenous inhibitor of DNA gyrase (YacG/DUF329 family)
MPRKRLVKLSCPICKQPVTSTGAEFPFCSERCRLLDLGKWASGEYRIPAPIQDTEDEFSTEAPPRRDEDE